MFLIIDHQVYEIREFVKERSKEELTYMMDIEWDFFAYWFQTRSNLVDGLSYLSWKVSK